jgi:hypothetical protein
MSNETEGKWIERVDKELLKVFKTTEEYNAWQESLLAIVGYASEESYDEELIEQLLADHLNASLELQDGLGRARFQTRKELYNEFLLENSGE